MTPKNLLLLCLVTMAARAGAMYQPELDQPQEQAMHDFVQRPRSIRERVCTPHCLRATKLACFYGSCYVFYRNVLGLPQPAPEVAIAAIALIQHPPQRIARAGFAVNQAGLRLCGRLEYHQDSSGL